MGGEKLQYTAETAFLFLFYIWKGESNLNGSINGLTIHYHFVLVTEVLQQSIQLLLVNVAITILETETTQEVGIIVFNPIKNSAAVTDCTYALLYFELEQM